MSDRTLDSGSNEREGREYAWGYSMGMCIGAVVHRLKHILHRCTCTHYAA